MQKYFIWQGQSPEIFFESAEVVRELWQRAFHYPNPAGREHLREGFLAIFSPILQHFVPVASVMAEHLGDVFEIGNGFGDQSRLVRILPMHSVSVGDFIQDAEGECHLVMPSGFVRLGRVTISAQEVANG